MRKLGSSFPDALLAHEWRRMVLPFKGLRASAIIVWMSDAITRHTSTIDPQKSLIELNPIPGNVIEGSIRAVPSAAALVHQSFSVSTPDDQHLVLRGTTPDGVALTITLRRFDPATSSTQRKQQPVSR